jgi:hypothetical protein
MVITCEILRWVSDEPEPGVVEARFIDARGKTWVLLDKSAIFTTEAINSNSVYPQAGVIRCEVLERGQSAAVGHFVRVRAIDAPFTDGDIEVFDVTESQLAPPLVPFSKRPGESRE